MTGVKLVPYMVLRQTVSGGGGRAGFGENDPEEVLELMQEYGISARLTFSNSPASPGAPFRQKMQCTVPVV